MNAEGLEVRKYLDAAVTQGQASQPGAAAAFAEAEAVILAALGKVQQWSQGVEPALKEDPETAAWYARELVQVEDAWESLDRLRVELSAATTAPEQIRIGQKSIKVLDGMIFLCACQTIPNELDNYLKNCRIGQSVNFVEVYKDQLASEDATRAVLAQLAPQGEVISGLIDLRNAKVIKVAPQVWRRWLSVGIIAVAGAVGFGLAGIVAHLGAWFPALKNVSWVTLNEVYVLVLFGVLLHWILDRLKLNRSGADITPFSEWLMWIHVNEVSIVIRIGTVWITIGAAIGLSVFNLDPSKDFQAVTYFTVGYFLDSTYDALIGRFNTFIGGQDPAENIGKGETI